MTDQDNETRRKELRRELGINDTGELIMNCGSYIECLEIVLLSTRSELTSKTRELEKAKAENEKMVNEEWLLLTSTQTQNIRLKEELEKALKERNDWKNMDEIRRSETIALRADLSRLKGLVRELYEAWDYARDHSGGIMTDEEADNDLITRAEEEISKGGK